MKNIFAASFLLFAIGDCLEGADSPGRPNIIYVLADDLGYGDLGCYGGRLPTPNLDRFARQGLQFNQHYAGCTVCAPSRCVLLTGKHMGHCRVRGNGPGTMRPDDVTIAEIMRRSGYVTGCTGKWGIGNPPPLDDPARNGFDFFYGYISMYHAHNFYPEFMIRNGARETLRNEVLSRWKQDDGRGVAIKRVDYAPDLVTREALAFVDRHHDQPFFLYYALNVPHTNNEAGRFSDRPEKGMEVPDFGPFAAEDWPAPEMGFAAMIRNLDRDFGQLMRKLETLGIDEKTLVIFSSDNGPHQEGGHQADFFDSNGPLRGRKRDLYEGGIRVPMLARWPGVIAPNSRTDHVSSFADIVPTLAELANAECPSDVDGISFVQTLKGDKDGQQQHEFLYWEFSEQGGKRAIRRGNWKLVQLQIVSASPQPAELYNLAEDLSEAHDVADQHLDIVNELTALMDQAHERSDQYPLFPSERQ